MLMIKAYFIFIIRWRIIFWITIKGYARKKKVDYPNANFEFLYALGKVNEFEGFNNPQEDEKYDLNVTKMD
ncbi:hypothetical protein [Aneurinibacillus aneurinilyticus]|uniref:hypothetical protein n=1 Tax=Aneurinibacillus aneurinilyticus TaxID=1391 RepID=UPI0035238F8A